MDVKKLFSMEEKKGFVTGGAQGIGKTIAQAFAELGADVAIVDLNEQKAQATAVEITQATGRHVCAYACNVADPNSVNKMIEDYEKDYQTINYAINNAGIFTG